MNGIVLDEAMDLVVESGSLRITDVTKQNKKTLLLLEKGELKEHPKVGVGINGYLDDENIGGLIRSIRKEFTEDGMHVHDVSYSNYKLEIDASYS